MSKRNGDRAKFNREHKKRMLRRRLSQELRKALDLKAGKEASPSPEGLGTPVLSTRLRQVKLENNSDPAEKTWEIVLPTATAEKAGAKEAGG